MDTQDLNDELNKILELSSSRIDLEDGQNKKGTGFNKVSSHVSFKARLNTETTLEAATGNEVQTGISFTNVLDRKANDKASSTTLNIAANEFVPAQLSKIPSASRPFSRVGQPQDEQSLQTFEDQENADDDGYKQKSHLPSKIPRLTNNNESNFPKQENEISMPIAKSQSEHEQFVEEQTLDESDETTDEYLAQNLNNAEIKTQTDISLNYDPTDVETIAITNEQSNSSLKPQTSLTESNVENQEAVVDDDGFERNFPKVPSGNLSRVESTAWMDDNTSFVTEEPIVVINLNHVKLSDGLRTFPRTSQNLDDNLIIEISQSEVTPQPTISEKKSKKSFIKRISNIFRRSTKD